MADKITFEDKEKVRDSVLPTKNKGTADDFNEIKAVVNSHADDIDGKQDTLVSGTNIKTVNGATLLGSGDITTTDTSLSTDNQAIPNATNREVSLGAGSTLKVGGVKHFEDGKSSRVALDSYISDVNLLPGHITDRVTNTKLIEPRFNNASTFKDIVYKAWLKLSTVDRTNLEATYTGDDSGIVNYDEDEEALFLYNGTVSKEILTKNGNGLIAVNDSSGVPTFYADLQTALETCKTGVNTVTLLGDITITTDILIRSGGTGIGNGYNYERLTIDFNGYKVVNSQSDSSSCFEIKVSEKNTVLVNPNIQRINGTTSSYALKGTISGSSGNNRWTIIGGGYIYAENGVAFIDIDMSSVHDADFGNCTFENLNREATVVLSSAKSIKNLNVLCGGTGASIGCQFGTIEDISNLTIESQGNEECVRLIGDCGKIRNSYIKSVNGIGINGNTTSVTDIVDCVIDSKLECFTSKMNIYSGSYTSETREVIDNVTGTIYGGTFIALAEKCIATVNETKILGGTFISKALNAISIANQTALRNIINATFISEANSVVMNGNISTLTNKINFIDCKFINLWDNANGHAIDFSTKGTGDVVFDNCKFYVANASANCLYSSVAKSGIKVASSGYNGATTPVNANVTLTSITTPPDTDGNYTI